MDSTTNPLARIIMLIRKYSQDGKTCLVTFTLPVQVHARFAYVYGDFTEWKKSSKEMSRQKNGGFFNHAFSTRRTGLLLSLFIGWRTLGK